MTADSAVRTGDPGTTDVVDRHVSADGDRPRTGGAPDCQLHRRLVVVRHVSLPPKESAPEANSGFRAVDRRAERAIVWDVTNPRRLDRAGSRLDTSRAAGEAVRVRRDRQVAHGLVLRQFLSSDRQQAVHAMAFRLILRCPPAHVTTCSRGAHVRFANGAARATGHMPPIECPATEVHYAAIGWLRQRRGKDTR